ncbi:hypothetical protein [Allomesorhizobium alhagi]|jgi:hypothetical protein|uniref:hypothetical protein n=1 Tax=Allomesorhizobium alhagi TaxID=475067 RepID=UPI001111C4FB|nr:hypothetical protein [Mesorhizobium alhagi]
MNQRKVVAAGTWYYDGLLPHRVEIHAFPARLSASRLAEDGESTGEYDESLPIPETLDGYLYECRPFYSGEHMSIEAVKAWILAQPWSPVTWDDSETEISN